MRQKEKAVQIFKNYLILFLFTALILTACGGTGKGSEGESEGGGSGEEKAAYMIRETDVPDPEEALAELRKEDDKIGEIDYQFKGDKLYRIVRQAIEKEGSDEAQEVLYYLQVLDPPYEAWKNYPIPASCWDEAAEGEDYRIRRIVAAEEERVWLKLERREDETCYLGVWSEDGSGELLSVLPEELSEADIVIGDGKAVGAYEVYHDSFLLLDGESEEVGIKARVNVPGSILGALQNPQNGDLLWCGFSEGKRGVWRVNDNAAPYLSEGQGNINLAAYSDGGILYLANSQDLWRCDEKGKMESLCHFFDQDYFVEDLYGMSVQAEDTLLMLARYEEKDHILQVTKTEGARQEKKKIVLAVPGLSPTSPLRRTVAQFNRRNPEYRVEIIEPKGEEYGLSFMERLQREMLAGDSGPDLFYELDVLGKAEDFAENGYLQEVSDLLPEKGTLWQAALETGVIRGRQYGIPYECDLHFVTYSRELTGGRDSWTLEEMMEAVRNSDVEVLQAGLSGEDIVVYYGLYDNDNKRFIDWEKGESHLNEAPFLEFLAFAKEYADKEDPLPFMELDTRLQEGKVAAFLLWKGGLEQLGELNELEARFQGKPAYIGFPREEGNGIYVDFSSFYVSSRTEQSEGCRAFLNFALSEEAQKDYAKLSETDWSTKLPVRISALEYKIQAKKQEKRYITVTTMDGIGYRATGLSEEQEAAFRFLLENARPANHYIENVRGIVEEELQPYFAGQRTAEDAADILNRRIQVYLDERN